MQQFFSQKFRSIINLCLGLAIGFLLVSFFASSTFANTVVKKAEIYKIRNQVDVSYQNKPEWNQAKLGDVIFPQDSVRTGANSRADILFNEGTLVRTGAGTTFRFPPGKRHFELTSGAALIMIRPEQGQSMINTPQAKVVSQGTALFVQHDAKTNASLIGVLTNSPAGLVKVSSNDGNITLELQAGQFVSVIQGVVGLVEHFVLPMFYETVELSAGLGLNPGAMETAIAQEPPEVQTTIRAIQAEIIEPLKNQQAWLQGFCELAAVEPDNLASLLQLLGIGTSGVDVSLNIAETNIPIIPFRSLSGVAWLGKYCQSNQTLPGLEPANKIPQ